MIVVSLLVFGVIFFIMGDYTELFLRRLTVAFLAYIILGTILIGIVNYYLNLGNLNFRDILILILFWPTRVALLFIQ